MMTIEMTPAEVRRILHVGYMVTTGHPNPSGASKWASAELGVWPSTLTRWMTGRVAMTQRSKYSLRLLWRVVMLQSGSDAVHEAQTRYDEWLASPEAADWIPR